MKKDALENFINSTVLLRLIPILGIILTSITCIPGCRIFQSPEGTPYTQILLALKLTTILAFIFILFYPKKIGVYGIQSFLYSVYWAVLPDSFYFSLMHTILCVSILIARGFFKKHAVNKIIMFIIFYFLLALCQLFYGKEHFVEYMTHWITTWVMFFLSFYYLLYVYYAQIKKASEIPFVLDECPFIESDADVLIVCRILQNEKYDSIARSLKVSERTIKRRTAKVFEYFGCADKLDFFARFSNHPVFYHGVEILSGSRVETEAFQKLIGSFIPE